MTTLMEILRYELGAAGEEAADRIEELEQQLAEREKQIVMLRQWFEVQLKDNDLHPDDKANIQAELNATKDLSGLVLCDAEPVGIVDSDYGTGKFLYFYRTVENETLLYKARKQP